MAKVSYVDTGVDVGSPAGTLVDLKIVADSRLQSGALSVPNLRARLVQQPALMVVACTG